MALMTQGVFRLTTFKASSIKCLCASLQKQQTFRLQHSTRSASFSVTACKYRTAAWGINPKDELLLIESSRPSFVLRQENIRNYGSVPFRWRIGHCYLSTLPREKPITENSAEEKPKLDDENGRPTEDPALPEKNKTNDGDTTVTPQRNSVFQRVKLAMRNFMQGCKLLFHDVKHAIRIRSKLKKLGNDVTSLTRTELRHMRQTSKDVVKTLPVTFVALLPIVGYAAPLLAFLFPRQLLSSHFWRPEQKERFAREDHEKRSQYYVPLLKEAGRSGREVGCYDLSRFCVKLIDGASATNDDVKQLKMIFREDDLSLKGMPRFHLVKLCKTWLAPAKWYMPRGLLRELLAYRIKRIIEDDDAIRRDGVSSLDNDEVALACHNRGLEEALHSDDCLRRWLIQWIELSVRTSPVRDISYVAHCAIFKSINFNCEDSKETLPPVDKR